MATPKFATVVGKSTKAATPYYIGLIQHESTMTKKETYRHLASKTNYSEAQIKAAFLALAKVLKSNADKGNDALVDGLARFKIYAKGSVAGSTGPWVKGVNYLEIVPVEANDFKDAMSGIIPVNVTEGLKPSISSVFDIVTGEYDLVTGTNVISIGGTNLAPDTTKTDEKAYLEFSDGTILPLTIQSSTLTLVKAKLSAVPTKTGKAKLVVATRCGMGTEYGVKLATRNLNVVAA